MSDRDGTIEAAEECARCAAVGQLADLRARLAAAEQAARVWKRCAKANRIWLIKTHELCQALGKTAENQIRLKQQAERERDELRLTLEEIKHETIMPDGTRLSDEVARIIRERDDARKTLNYFRDMGVAWKTRCKYYKKSRTHWLAECKRYLQERDALRAVVDAACEFAQGESGEKGCDCSYCKLLSAVEAYTSSKRALAAIDSAKQ